MQINNTLKTPEPRAETAGPMPTASPVSKDGDDIGVIIAGVAGGVGGVLLILGVAYYFVHAPGATHPKPANPDHRSFLHRQGDKLHSAGMVIKPYLC